ncbi:transmembrane protein, partial [Cystoisospora suis]
EVQQLAKGATVDLVELQNQIGDVQIFEALKVRRQGKSRRWKFFIPEGSAGGGDKKSLRWLLLTLNQILVLDPYHSESEHGDTEVSVGGRNSLLHSGSSLEEEKESK